MSSTSEYGDAPLPDDWAIKPFSEIADYQTGRTPSRANPRYWSTHHAAQPWASISDMKPHALIIDTAERISQDAVTETFRGRISKAGTLLMSFKLTIGRVATLGIDACHNEAIISIYPKSQVNQKYLEYFLAQVNYTDYQDRAVKGHTLNQEKIDRIAITLPPKPEQQKIAAVLWKMQRAVAIQDRLIAATHGLKQSAMQHIFTHGLRGKRLKDTAIGMTPQNWRVDRLVELAHFQRGFDITKNQQKTGTVPVISSGGIKSWHSEAKVAGPGVVIGRKGSIGTVRYTESDYWPHDTTLWSTDFRGNFPLFVYYRLSVLDLARLDSGAANPALNRNFLHEEIVSWPGPDEQRDIAAALATIDRKLAHHQKKRAALNDLFQTTLHQLMTAQIRVADLDIDTSEVTTPQPQGVAA